MEEEQKLQMINEIKRIERELYLKRSELAAAEAMKHVVKRQPQSEGETDSRENAR